MRRDFYPLVMATSESNDSNILDAETISWSVVVYSLLAATLIALGGYVYYYYQLNQREVTETQAHEALLKAKTPEQLVQVADQFPKTDQATLALLAAAKDSFDKSDYDAAIKSYQRVLNIPEVNPDLRDSAQLGLASTLEARGKPDDAIEAYLVVAHRGTTTPYAPFAYSAVAAIYEQRGDRANEKKILTEMTNLGVDSPFVKEAESALKTLNVTPVAPSAVSPTIQVTTPPAPVPPTVKK